MATGYKGGVLNDEIIRMLQDRPSTSNKDIGDRLNVSEVTIATRIRAMEEDNILRVILQRDLRSYGYNSSALLGIFVHGRAVEDVAKDLSSIDECISVSIALTSPDIFVQLAAVNDKSIQHIVEQRIAIIDGVKHCEITIALDIIKLDNIYGGLGAS